MTPRALRLFLFVPFADGLALLAPDGCLPTADPPTGQPPPHAPAFGSFPGAQAYAGVKHRIFSLKYSIFIDGTPAFLADF